jgi:hypothetical protein
MITSQALKEKVARKNFEPVKKRDSSSKITKNKDTSESKVSARVKSSNSKFSAYKFGNSQQASEANDSQSRVSIQ